MEKIEKIFKNLFKNIFIFKKLHATPKKCWSVVSAKIFDVLSPAPHSMLGIHFSSTHRPFPRWEIDFSCAPAPHTMLSTRSMRVMMIYKNILDAEHFYIRSLIDNKEEKVVHLL